MNKTGILRFIELADKIPGMDDYLEGDAWVDYRWEVEDIFSISAEERELREYLRGLDDGDLLDIAALMLLGRERVVHPADFEDENIRDVEGIRRFSRNLSKDKVGLVEYVIDLVPASNTRGYFKSGYEWLQKVR